MKPIKPRRMKPVKRIPHLNPTKPVKQKKWKQRSRNKSPKKSKESDKESLIANHPQNLIKSPPYQTPHVKLLTPDDQHQITNLKMIQMLSCYQRNLIIPP